MEKASKLTKERIDYLLQNENVAGVTEKNIFFTVEFKEKFYELYQQGMKNISIFYKLGVDPNIVGYNRVRSFVYHLLDDIKCCRGFVGYTNKNCIERTSDSTEEKLKKALTELEYVKQENQFLKRIVAVGKKNAKHRD